MRIVSFESQKIITMTFSADWTVFALFRKDYPEKINCLSLGLWRIIMYLGFIYGDDLLQKILRLSIKEVQTLL